MPTYEYACANCHRHTEVEQRITDPPLAECPHCGGKLRRVFHPVGIVLKGSGFYSTDNRSGKRFTGPKEPKAEPASEAQTGTGKGEKGDTTGKAEKGERPATKEPSKSKASEKKSSGTG